MRVREDRIGFGNLFELFSGAWVLVSVGMIFQREFSKGVFDRTFIRVALHAQGFIIILLCFWHWDLRFLSRLLLALFFVVTKLGIYDIITLGLPIGLDAGLRRCRL